VTTEYTIQELSQKSGVSRRNIYFYTQQGILPPPSGAGLAARYAEIHLLRLQAIPVLRSQGLRLDQIRTRLQQSDDDALRQLLEQAQSILPAAASKTAESRLPPTPFPTPAPYPVPVPYPGYPAGEPYLHYPLPAGLTLTAPAHLSPEDRQRLSALLRAAQQIFNQPGYPTFPGWASFTRSEGGEPRSQTDSSSPSPNDPPQDDGSPTPTSTP